MKSRLVFLIFLQFVQVFFSKELNAQTYQWVHPYQSCTSKGLSVAFDYQSGLYFCGQIRPVLSLFDSLSVPAYGYEDGIFCKIDSSSGQIIWMHHFGSTFAGEKIYDLKLAGSSIYLWGDGGSPPFGNIFIDGISYHLPGGFFAKFDTSGTLTWAISRLVQDFAVGASGNIYVASTVNQNYGIIKLNPAGVVTDSLTGYSITNAYSGFSRILCDANENIYWVKLFSDTINFQGTIYTADQAGTTDILLVKCDNNLNVQSVKQISGQYYDYIFDMILKSNGELALLSALSDSTYFDNVLVPDTGSRLALITTDNNLDLIDYKFINSQLPSSGMIEENDQGDFFIGLTFYTNITNSFVFNGDTTNCTTNSNIGILAKLNQTGNIIWNKVITGNTNANYSSGSSSLNISQPHGDKLYIGGTLLYSAIFDTTTYSSPGGAYTALLIDTTYSNTVGLESNYNQDEIINVFPNPANNMINIHCKENANLCIIDLTGKKILEHTENMKNYTVDISSLSEGIYFIEIQSQKKSNYRKIIKY